MDDTLPMKMMNMLAGVTPVSILVSQLKDAINKWESSKTDEDFNELCMDAVLVTMKKMHGGSNTPEDTMKAIDRLNKLFDDSQELRNLHNRMQGN